MAPSSARSDLERERNRALRLTGARRVRTPKAAEAFLADVGLALRYGPNPGLPLASVYRAVAGPDPDKAGLVLAMELTNHLLDTSAAIEVDVIAGRIALVHRALMPALYALVRRGRAIDDLTGVSLAGRSAYRLIRAKREVSAGDVRRHLGATATPRSDPAYEALGELRRLLLVDRGPFTIATVGIPYLSKEGYPHHFFHEAHADLVRASRQYSIAEAADELIGGYLRAARFGVVRKLATLFQACVSRSELDASLTRLSDGGQLQFVVFGRDRAVVGRPGK